jgi:acyl-CoA dehydrogenase
MTATNPTPTRFTADELLTESAQTLFAGTCGFDAVQAAEDTGWAPDIWQAVADAGFAWIGLPESAGGSGGTLLDAAEVLRIAGANAAPIPLAETAMLGGWLLTRGGLPLPDGPVSIVPNIPSLTSVAAVTSVAAGPVDGAALTARPADDGSLIVDGEAARVPWAGRSDIVAALLSLQRGPGDSNQPDSSVIVAIDPTADGITLTAAPNLAGEPRDTLTCTAVAIPADRWSTVDDPAAIGDELMLRGALSRTMLMAGALEAMSRLTVDYTEDRQQFGRPVSRFQAVAQHLVWGAQDAAITNMAAQVAAGRASTDRGVLGARFEIASARTVANDAAGTATRWAHQAHGAMGMTQEYALHHLSRRLWAWRHEWSSPGNWPATVGRTAETAGADGLYPLIASQ